MEGSIAICVKRTELVILHTFGWVAVTPLPAIKTASDRLGITAAAVEVTDTAVTV